MGLMWKLGFKNIRRNFVRSGLTIIAVMLCSAGLLLFHVFYTGAINMFLRSFVNQSGHVRLLHPKLKEKKRLGEGRFFVEDVKGIRKKLKNNKNIISFTPQIKIGAFIDVDQKTEAPAQSFSEKSSYAKTLKASLQSGKMPRAAELEILLGEDLAEQLKAEKGEFLKFALPSKGKKKRTRHLLVSGIVKMKQAAQNKMLFAPYEVARMLKPEIKAQGTTQATIFYSEQSTAAGLGMDPADARRSLQIHKKVAAGQLMKSKGREIMMGKRLADKLKANVGEKITLLGQTRYGSTSMYTFRLVGIVDMGNALQNKMFYMSLKMAQEFMNIPNQASHILLHGKDLWRSQMLANSIKKANLPGKVAVQAWQDTPFAASILPLVNVMIFILGGLVIFIGGIGLLNTLMMSVLERRTEIGLMMALGLTPRQVAGIFVTEGLVFGVVGAVIGVVLGLLASIPFVTHGISFGSSEATAKLPIAIEQSFKGVITPEAILAGLLVGILATVAGALWPAYKASRMNPVDALRKS